MHLCALTVDVGYYLLLIRNTCLLLLDETICDSFDLSANWVQSIVVVLDAISLFLLNSRLELIPIQVKELRKWENRKAFQSKTYMRL